MPLILTSPLKEQATALGSIILNIQAKEHLGQNARAGCTGGIFHAEALVKGSSPWFLPLLGPPLSLSEPLVVFINVNLSHK